MHHLYFIRHVQSQANAFRILASHLPYPVTRAGKLDARRIALELSQKIHPDYLYSSPLLRAIQTAEAFSRVFGLDIIADDNLVEQNLGKFSGMTYRKAKAMPDYRENPLERWNWLPEGGESYSMVAGRILKFLNTISSLPDGKTVLIVTHAVVFRVLRGAVENTLPEYPTKFPNNGEIWKIDFHGPGFQHTIESIMLGASRKFKHRP